MDLFAKLLHTLCTMPWHNTMDLTVSLQVMGDAVRLFVTGA